MAKETNIRHKAFGSFQVDPGTPAVLCALDPVSGRFPSNGVFIIDPASAQAPGYNNIGDYSLFVREDEGLSIFDHIEVTAFGVAALYAITLVSATEINIVLTDNAGAPLEAAQGFSVVVESYEPMS